MTDFDRQYLIKSELFSEDSTIGLIDENMSEEMIRGIYTSAYCYYQNGKYREAANMFRYLTLADVNNSYYWSGLAGSQKMLKEHEKALQSYCLAVILDQMNASLYLHMADCLFALKRNDEALQCLNSAELAAKGSNKSNEEYQSLIDHVELIRNAWSNTEDQGV